MTRHQSALITPKRNTFDSRGEDNHTRPARLPYPDALKGFGPTQDP
jgi:hypothetical protein